MSYRASGDSWGTCRRVRRGLYQGGRSAARPIAMNDDYYRALIATSDRSWDLLTSKMDLLYAKFATRWEQVVDGIVTVMKAESNETVISREFGDSEWA